MCIKVTGKLTVYFDPPFWVGVFEEISDGKVATCKVVFGAEPKDYQVYEFVLRNYCHLKFSQPAPLEGKSSETKMNPKRLQRLIKKQTSDIGIGTKAQRALKSEYEANKLIRKRVSKIKKNRLEREKFRKNKKRKN